MATYLGTHGGRIQNYTTDPDNPNTGEVWYNGTANTIKIEAVTTAGAWATGGSLNTGRRAMSGAGLQTTALGFGGSVQPASPPFTALNMANTEKYDGTSWTEVNDLNTGRGYAAGSGIQTSALFYGGSTGTIQAITESWNGTNWTEVADLNQSRYILGGAGTSNTSALAFGGASTPPYTIHALTESYDGSSWTEVNDMNTARQGFSGWGSSTAAIAATGETSPARVTLTETWNGTNWTEVGDLNTARSGTGSSRVDSTSGIVFGGFESAPTDSNVNKVELWNGTNWTETTDLSGTAYQQQSGAGTGSSAISFGGEGPANQMRAGTEEWTGAGAPQVRTISTD